MSLSLRRGLHVVLMLLPTDEKVLHLGRSAVVDGDFLGQDFTPSKEALQNLGVTLKWRNLTNAAALAESPCRITQG